MNKRERTRTYWEIGGSQSGAFANETTASHRASRGSTCHPPNLIRPGTSVQKNLILSHESTIRVTSSANLTYLRRVPRLGRVFSATILSVEWSGSPISRASISPLHLQKIHTCNLDVGSTSNTAVFWALSTVNNHEPHNYPRVVGPRCGRTEMAVRDLPPSVQRSRSSLSPYFGLYVYHCIPPCRALSGALV